MRREERGERKEERGERTEEREERRERREERRERGEERGGVFVCFGLLPQWGNCISVLVQTMRDNLTANSFR